MSQTPSGRDKVYPPISRRSRARAAGRAAAGLGPRRAGETAPLCVYRKRTPVAKTLPLEMYRSNSLVYS